MASSELSPNPSVELKVFAMNETNNATTLREQPERSVVDSEPLQSRIQQDLIKLRRLIKARQKKLAESSNSQSRAGVSSAMLFIRTEVFLS